MANVAGERLKPWSPFDLRALRDVGTADITFTWQRRTRLATRSTGASPLYVPLGEDSEEYELEVYDGAGYATVLRTLTGLATPEATYTAAQQTTDFGAPQSTVYVRVYQISAAIGRGHHLQSAA